MSNFESELEALVLQWLARGDDPESMAAAMSQRIAELMEMVESKPV